MIELSAIRRPGVAAALLTLCIALPLQARGATSSSWVVPAHGVIGVEEAHLTPEFWIGRLSDPDRVRLDRAAIAVQNARLFRVDPSMHDLRALPALLSRAQVATWIERLSRRPQKALYGIDGTPIPKANLDALDAAVALKAIPATQATRYGLVVHRADLRTFPTALRVFSTPGDTDIDRFQESALFPGDPVAIVHASRDGDWWFVVSPRYAAWIEKRHVAEGSAAQVFGYAGRSPYRVVTGATVETVDTRERPALSRLQLDMGLRLPLSTTHAPDQPINGQHPYTAHVIELPTRDAYGALHFAPALLPKRADSAPDHLPLTPANIIRQGFKFLGERYGWGHMYDGRDCSGFVAEVYRSMGVELPRNTGDQAKSPALDRIAFTETTPRAAREAAVRALQVGDLVYIPGHMMMVIGAIDGEPYVIHDTTGLSYRTAAGALRRSVLNGVSVSPLTPLMFNQRERYIDRMTAIARIRSTAQAPGE